MRFIILFLTLFAAASNHAHFDPTTVAIVNQNGQIVQSFDPIKYVMQNGYWAEIEGPYPRRLTFCIGTGTGNNKPHCSPVPSQYMSIHVPDPLR